MLLTVWNVQQMITLPACSLLSQLCRLFWDAQSLYMLAVRGIPRQGEGEKACHVVGHRKKPARNYTFCLGVINEPETTVLPNLETTFKAAKWELKKCWAFFSCPHFSVPYQWILCEHPPYQSHWHLHIEKISLFEEPAFPSELEIVEITIVKLSAAETMTKPAVWALLADFQTEQEISLWWPSNFTWNNMCSWIYSELHAFCKQWKIKEVAIVLVKKAKLVKNVLIELPRS